MEERLAAQGRLGVQTAQFGGTPEQLAFGKAQAEARNAAMLQAMGQAQAEQAQLANQAQMFTGMGSQLSQADLQQRCDRKLLKLWVRLIVGIIHDPFSSIRHCSSEQGGSVDEIHPDGD